VEYPGTLLVIGKFLPIPNKSSRSLGSKLKIAPKKESILRQTPPTKIFQSLFVKEKKVYLNYTFHISSPRRRFSFLGFEIRLPRNKCENFRIFSQNTLVAEKWAAAVALWCAVGPSSNGLKVVGSNP